MKKYFKYIPFLIVAILVGVTVAYAQVNKLIPSGDSKTDQMYSLTDIYNLTEGNQADTRTGDIAPTPGTIDPNGTGKTLTEVYNAVKGVMGNVVIPPTFASSDVAQYDCSWFTNMTDSTQDPSPTSEQICGMNRGCTWNGDTSECDGGVVTSLSLGMTWYAAKAACAASTRDGQTAGTWRLPTQLELLNLFIDNSYTTPTGFQSGNYWSGITSPARTVNAYTVYMGSGHVVSGGKSGSGLVRCAR